MLGQKSIINQKTLFLVPVAILILPLNGSGDFSFDVNGTGSEEDLAYA